MSTLSVGDEVDDRDAPLDTIPRRCEVANADQVWRLARAWQGSRARGELVDAALGLAAELGLRREARRAMTEAASCLRASPGGREASKHLNGTDILFRAQAAAGDVALAVFLGERLSPEVRDALVAPWSVVFGAALPADPAGRRPGPTGSGTAGLAPTGSSADAGSIGDVAGG
jgi:hypothetical protein